MLRFTRVARPQASLLGRRCFSKDVRMGNECRALMLQGINKLADAVQTTLGPKGRNVLIEQSWGAPKITKDGVTVAKSIDFEDKHENIGAQLIKSVASKANDVAGDGTTTATILARAIYAEGVKSVSAGLNPMDLKRGIDQATQKVTELLKDNTRKISSPEEIKQVASISANNDFVIGELIANAMEKVGSEGVITVQDGKTLFDELEVVEGMKFDRGYLSPYFITNTKNQSVEMEKPAILLYEKKISTIQSIMPVLEQVAKTQQPLVIIAEDVEGEALAALVINRIRAGLKVAAMKAPGFGDNRKANMQDLAVLTGGTLISEDAGFKLEEVTLEHLGSCGKLTATKDETIILDGAANKTDIEARCALIRDTMAGTESEYEKEKLHERLAKLQGGVAVIKVGGASEVEVNEKKDRVDDALNATRAAVEEGIVPGGGSALLYASQALEGMKTGNFDQDLGIQIMAKALRVPAVSICNNAGLEGAVVVGKLLEQNTAGKIASKGMNAQSGEFVDMIDAGIIDPTKVVRTALVSAGSVGGSMVTSEAMVVELPKEEPAMPAGGGGMPGGMGGMGGGMF